MVRFGSYINFVLTHTQFAFGIQITQGINKSVSHFFTASIPVLDAQKFKSKFEDAQTIMKDVIEKEATGKKLSLSICH